MKKVTSLPIALRVLAITVILGLTACNNPFFDWEEPGNGGGKPGKPPVVTDCKQSGKMVTIACGPSIYGNLWIQTESNEYLRPCDQSFQTIAALDLKEGDDVKFSYRKINNCTKCKKQVTCSATIPQHTHVIIDCISVTNPPSAECPSLVVDENAHKETSYVHVISAVADGNFIKLKVGYSGCSILPKEAFKLSWNGSFAKSLPPQVWLFPGLNVPTTLCQAYFTTELCFDATMLRSNSSSKQVEVHIGDQTILF